MAQDKTLTGVVLDEHIELSVSELCRCCSVRQEVILSLVEEGVLVPSGRDRGEFRFAGSSVKRARRAIRIHKELEINLPGVALALELLDEVERLRDRLQAYERRSRR